MFIHTVPSVPNIKIINKTIIYSDIVLPIKEKGENLKITSISNITESNFEECLKTIFKSNPEIIFNTIQYSKKDNKIYFYTDKDISLKEWKDRNVIIYQPISSNTEILEEIKNILTQEPNKDPNCISLYDVARLMKSKNSEYRNMIDSYENSFECIIKREFSPHHNVTIGNFNYDRNELEIRFSYWGNPTKIIFSKKDGDLYIVSSETTRGQKILALLGNQLSELYDKLLQYSEYKNTEFHHPNSINSKFKIDVNIYHISIFTESNYKREFNLSSYSYKNGYDYMCNSNNIINVVKNNESELFKRIFIKIEDCPEWTRSNLSKTRKNQLIEQQKNEEAIQQEKQKKQKKLELKRKLFPFLKNR